MIQLYKPDNTEYSKNGDNILEPLQAKFSCTINGTWSLTIICAIDDVTSCIEEQSVIKCDTNEAKNQLFRIKKVVKTNYIVTINAVPIALDAANEIFLFDVRPTSDNGQQALEKIFANDKYTVQSDITTVKTAYYINQNAIEALNGSNTNSFVNLWGGEIWYNNYNVVVNDQLGINNGMRVEVGLNMTGINVNVDTSSLVTKIIPIGYNGIGLDDNQVVESSIASTYPISYYQTMNYPDVKLASDTSDGTGYDSLEEAQAELIRLATLEFSENERDKPSMTVEISMIDISKSDDYVAFKELLKLHLGDTVVCKHKRLGIEITNRVISYTYDVATQQLTDIVLGEVKNNYFQTTANVVASASKVIDTSTDQIIAEKIAGIINAENTSLRAQRGVAQTMDIVAALFENTDPESEFYGATCHGTQGSQYASRRNAQDTDWIWETAISAAGINTAAIVTGIISDVLAKNYWNLDSGKLTTNDITINYGSLANWNVSKEKGLYSSYEYTAPDYTAADYAKVQSYIMGKVELSDDEYERLDVNGDGMLSAADYMIIKNIVEGSIQSIWTYQYEINAEDPYNFIKIKIDDGEWEGVSIESITKSAMRTINDKLRDYEQRLLILEAAANVT